MPWVDSGRGGPQPVPSLQPGPGIFPWGGGGVRHLPSPLESLPAGILPSSESQGRGYWCPFGDRTSGGQGSGFRKELVDQTASPPGPAAPCCLWGKCPVTEAPCQLQTCAQGSLWETRARGQVRRQRHAPLRCCQPGTWTELVVPSVGRGQAPALLSLRGISSGMCEVLAWGWSKTCWHFHFSVFGPRFRDVWVRGS